MKTKKKADNQKDQSQWEYKERTVAVYHFEIPKRTALMTAALKGRLKMVKLLLLFQKKENIFKKNEDGETVLHYAVLGCNIEIIKFFLSKGHTIDETDNDGLSLLMTAVRNASIMSFRDDSVEVVRFLLDNKASIDHQDERGVTALMIAVEGAFSVINDSGDTTPNLQIVKLLIEYGADVNLKNKEGETALDKAVYLEFQTVIDYLVANGVKGKK